MVKKQGYLVNPVTGVVNGELTLEVFPRKRGYEVIGVLYRPGVGPTFASHGRYPSKSAAVQAMREVFQAMKRNPAKIANPASLYQRFHGTPPAKVLKVKFSPPKPGEKLVAIGFLEEVVYKPFGSSQRRGQLFHHQMGDTGNGINPERPILAVSQDGKRLYIIKNKAKTRMTERGIIS